MSVWQKFFVILLAGLIFGGTAYFARLALHPAGWRSRVPWVTYVHPNVKKLKEAQRLFDEGKLREAREIAVNALTTAPDSPVTRDLRDLVGDVNTQLFFSNQPTPRKTDYTVKSGDALASIARKLKSTTDAIMRVNELDSTLIRPGEKLLVPRLDFTITIDLPRERVVVHDSHGFFTQYPIAAADLPPSRTPKLETKVQAKSFWKNGRPIARGHGLSEEATARIYLRSRGYVLYGVEQNGDSTDSGIDVKDEDSRATLAASEENRPSQGIAMLKNDIAELELLIRKGTPVTIILDRAK